MPWNAIAIGIIPSIGVGLVFWLAMRAVVRADRNERRALAVEEAKLGADAEAGQESTSPSDVAEK